jgi:hypothetical protein
VADENDGKGGGESTLTVLVAMAANAGLGVLKLVAAIFTGSAAMYAEAARYGQAGVERLRTGERPPS